MAVLICDVKQEVAVRACAGASAPDLYPVPVAQELYHQVVVQVVNIKGYGAKPVFDV